MRLVEAATELEKVEQQFRDVYRIAGVMAIQGSLPDAVRQLVHARRDQVWEAETRFRQELVAGIRMYTPDLDMVDRVIAAIPEPIRYPDLPRPGEPISWPVYAPPPQSLSGLGIVAAAPPVWVAIVVTVIGLTALAALGLWALEVTVSLAQRIVSERELTKRYRSELEAIEARYQHCLDQGGTPAECNEAFPVPDLPLLPEASEPASFADTVSMAVKIGGVVLVGGAVMWLINQLPEKRSRGIRALPVSDYQLEV